MLGKYDICLKEHLTLSIEKSMQTHQHKSGSKGGRGSLVTFLSKTTIDYIITTIKNLMKVTIAAEIRESGMYSIQINTTPDITSQDQCSVVIRYATDIIHEQLVAVIRCEASTGLYFAQRGASNMQGQCTVFLHCYPRRPPLKSMCGATRTFSTLCWQTQHSVYWQVDVFFPC